MVSELTQAVTLLFRRTGKSPQSKKRLVMIASMDLHWFSPSDAEKFLDKCLEMNLLKQEGDGLLPTFDITVQDVPIDFSPDMEILKESDTSLFMRIVEATTISTKKERAQIISEINEYQEKFDVAAEAAALFVGKKYGAPVEGMFDEVDKELCERARGG